LAVKVYAFRDQEAGVESPLTLHLARVGEASCRVAGRMVAPGRRPYSVLGEPLGVDGGAAVRAAAGLAGLLHDLGKASGYYQVERRARSFPGHEALSAALAYEAHRDLLHGSPGLAALLALAAWAVARHHSAMEGRHPRDMRDIRSPAYREALKAVEALDPATVEAVTREAYPPLTSLAGPLGRAAERLRGNARLLGEALAWASDPRKPSELLGVREAEWLVLVETVAGALIVGDILVAGEERRASREGDEESGWPVYAAAWLRELGFHGELRRVVEGGRGCLDSSLAPLLPRG